MAQQSVRSNEMSAETRQIVDELIRSYWMELETVQNYLANSVNLQGIRAKEIKQALGDDVTAELGHARRLAERIHVLGGEVPGSDGFQAEQRGLQPPDDPTNVVQVIEGVIDAELQAIDQYKKIIRLCDDVDPGTQDMAIELLQEEESHYREFCDFLAEYRSGD